MIKRFHNVIFSLYVYIWKKKLEYIIKEGAYDENDFACDKKQQELRRLKMIWGNIYQ